jgi:hypothetical protein
MSSEPRYTASLCSPIEHVRDLGTLPSIARQPDFNLPDPPGAAPALRQWNPDHRPTALAIEHIFLAMFGFATALMTTVAISAAATAGVANPAFIVCVPSAVLLGSVTVMTRAMRRANRKRETDQLTAALRRNAADH